MLEKKNQLFSKTYLFFHYIQQIRVKKVQLFNFLCATASRAAVHCADRYIMELTFSDRQLYANTLESTSLKPTCLEVMSL